MKIWKYLSFGTLAVLVVAMMAATVLERFRGTEEALRLVYHSPWFIVLWFLTAFAGLVLLLRRKFKVFTLGLHLGFVVILAGALVTFLTGESGELHLREGASATAYTRDDGAAAALPFGLRLETFSIDWYPGTRMPKDYISEVTVLPENERRTISMNHILKWGGYRFYQADYDEDLHGSILAVSHDPWGVGISYAGYLILLVGMLGFFFQKETHFRGLWRQISALPRWVKPALIVTGLVLLGGFFWLLCHKWLFQPRMPVLRSPLLWVHVLCMMVSYTILGLVALNGLVGLVLPSDRTRAQLRDMGQLALYPAVFLLAVGTFVGAVWANISWGNYWAWDPKETWALVTMLVYSFALHSGSIKAFGRPRFFHWFTLLAFLCVMMTYFGVNLLLGGIHAYS